MSLSPSVENAASEVDFPSLPSRNGKIPDRIPKGSSGDGDDTVALESGYFSPQDAKAYLLSSPETWDSEELQEALNCLGLHEALKAFGAEIVSNPYGRDDEVQYFQDDKGSIIPCAFVIRTREIDKAARLLVAAEKKVMMIGACTSATGNFEVEGVKSPSLDIYGIQSQSVLSAEKIKVAAPEAAYLRTDEVRLNREEGTVEVGAGIPPLLLNEWLEEQLGHEFYLPFDATTKGTLHFGAGAATHAQGPSRIQLADYTQEMVIADGKTAKVIQGEDVRKHMGLGGKTGAITQLKLNLIRRPPHSFGFFVPLRETDMSNWPGKIAELLTALKDSLNIRLENKEEGMPHEKKLVSDWENGVVMGVEEMTRESLELAKANGNGLAEEYLAALDEANSDVGVFLVGNSRFNSADELMDDEKSPLRMLYDMTPSQIPTNALVGDDIRYYVADPSKLTSVDALREEFPMAARKEGKTADHITSLSTDVNTRILNPAQYDPETLMTLYKRMLQPYLNFENKVEMLRDRVNGSGVKVHLHRYGHFHPNSVDLHRRVNIWAGKENREIYTEVVAELRALNRLLIEELIQLREQEGKFEVMPGEKGLLTPPALAVMTEQQRQEVGQTLAAGPVAFQASLQGSIAKDVTALRMV